MQALGRASDPAQEMPALEAFDRQLKARSINPGTSADMTVATLVAMDLEDSLEARFHECSTEVTPANEFAVSGGFRPVFSNQRQERRRSQDGEDQSMYASASRWSATATKSPTST